MWNAASNNAAAAMRSVVTIQQLSAFGMRNVSSVSSASNVAAGSSSGSTTSGFVLPPPIVTSVSSSFGPSQGSLELMDLFFQIVVDRRVVYVSETVRCTLNPIWMPIDFRESLVGRGFIGSSFEVLVFWAQSGVSSGCSINNETFVPALPLHAPCNLLAAAHAQAHAHAQETAGSASSCFSAPLFHFKINCRELEPLPISLEEVVTLPFNTCVFEFAGRVYLRKETVQYLFDTGVIAPKYAKRRASTVNLREYDLLTGMSNVERIVALREANKSMVQANDQVKEQVAKRMEELTLRTQQEQKRAELEARMRRMRQDVQLRRENLARVQAVMKEEQQIIEADLPVPSALVSIVQMNKRYKEDKQAIFEKRCEVMRMAHKIRLRQAQYVKQLDNVYPIQYVGSGEFSIRGIKITKEELLNSRDEEMMSTGLGYVAHLVFMLSKYLNVNLRYRIVPFASRSYLKDEINDADGEYPLYRKGAERDRYVKAILFLRRNVEQLLVSRGLEKNEEPQMLERLKTLTDDEIAYLANDREVSNSSSSSIKKRGSSSVEARKRRERTDRSPPE